MFSEMLIEKFEWDLLHRVRQEKPLIHCITNYVTANDVANIVLAAGASPVMADEQREVEEVTALSKALVLNLGTLREVTATSMLLAGKKAAALERPIILDPVGAGASAFRRETAVQMIRDIPCTVIRGNASEIRTLAGVAAYSQGVDADERDRVREGDFTDAKEFIKALSKSTGAIIVMTGEIDMIASGDQVCRIRNGHPMMAKITGAGCMMDGMIAAFLAADRPENIRSIQHMNFCRTIYAAAAAGICGELAYEKTKNTNGGTGSFRMHYIDAMSRLSDKNIQGGAKIEF